MLFNVCMNKQQRFAAGIQRSVLSVLILSPSFTKCSAVKLEVFRTGTAGGTLLEGGLACASRDMQGSFVEQVYRGSKTTSRRRRHTYHPLEFLRGYFFVYEF
jgi:hypothetical protein